MGMWHAVEASCLLCENTFKQEEPKCLTVWCYLLVPTPHFIPTIPQPPTFRLRASELTVSDEQDGGEGDSNNETLNHVQLEEHIVTTDFSHYTTSIKCLAGSHFTPQLAEDSAYSTTKTLSLPTTIIDSGTSTHIHSKHDDFLSLDTSTSHNIKGFGGAKSCVTGRGTALITVWLPSGHKTCIKLDKVCLVPNSSPTLLSISHLDEAKIYTLLGMEDVYHSQWMMEVDSYAQLCPNLISVVQELKEQTDFTTLTCQICPHRNMHSQQSAPLCQN